MFPGAPFAVAVPTPKNDYNLLIFNVLLLLQTAHWTIRNDVAFPTIPAPMSDTPQPSPSLPRAARLPINRCNLPAAILGGLTFQRHPTVLEIDGVREMHRPFFARLDGIDAPEARAEAFMDYMTVSFRLESLEDAGLTPGQRKGRAKANYLRLLRGWSFDSNGQEGAVLKGWVESRFGLLPRFHGGVLINPQGDLGGNGYKKYLHDRSAGLYGTNALEAQLDLVHRFCQYELARRFPAQTHLRLYRGANRLDDHEIIEKIGGNRRIVLLNNLNSFTDNRERADEFGDFILQAETPLAKVFFFNRLLPGMLKGEDEFVVLGGLYEVAVV